MRRFALLLAAGTLLALAAPAVAQLKTPPDPPPPTAGGLLNLDASTILKEIGRLSPYQAPNLPLKTDQGYAHTVKELEPFRHVEPFKTHFREQMEYTGAGRTIPEPAADALKSVKIGFIGPLYPTVSVATGGGKSHEAVLGQKMFQGSTLAIEEANARGGYAPRSIPYELVVSNDNGLWGSSGNEITKLAYRDKVWAILGTIDGANSHIAIRVALKCELFMMNTGDTDPTFIETNIPWVGRNLGDDRQMNYLLIDYMYRKLGLKRVGIIRASNRYGRFGVREIHDGSRRLEHPIVFEMAYKVGQPSFEMEVDRLKSARLDAVVFWGDAPEGAAILNRMREVGMTQPFLTCDRCVSDEFVSIAGPNAEGVVAAFPWNPDRDDPALVAFKERFRARFGEEAETYAAHAYDGMNMIIWAIEQGGLNRAKIRDLIAYRSEPWHGVTGEIPLSSVIDDIGEVFLARREGGRWHFQNRQELGIPRDTSGVTLPGATCPDVGQPKDEATGAPTSAAATSQP
jgi:ABC-type branched-subunit amino acid transport system substrate-binding protein